MRSSSAFVTSTGDTSPARIFSETSSKLRKQRSDTEQISFGEKCDGVTQLQSRKRAERRNGGIDIEAAGDDHVFGPVNDVEKVFTAEISDVADDRDGATPQRHLISIWIEANRAHKEPLGNGRAFPRRTAEKRLPARLCGPRHH